MTVAAPLRADLVLEGGGVRGLGLAGAVSALAAAGYSFPRVAGTSAGAITGAVVAALQAAGEPLTRLEDITRTLNLRRFRDNSGVERLLGPLAPLVSLVTDEGLYDGDYLLRWLRGVLADLGVRTWGDLALPTELVGELPPERAYRLVVTATDLSRRRLVRLPWDYRSAYALPAVEQPVAEAVRASASIPFFFEPVGLRTASGGTATLVDGGVVSNFPIGIFDVRSDPRWPTFGVRLLPAEQTAPEARPRAVGNLLSLAFALAETVVGARDALVADEPCTVARTIYVDTSTVSPVDFGLSVERQRELIARGERAAREFLQTWDYERYLAVCRRPWRALLAERSA